MIEHPIKPNSKNPIILGVQSTFNVKNPKKWIFRFLFDCWIGLDFFSSIQSNNLRLVQQKSKNPLFWIFGVVFGWMFNHPSNPKSRQN
jgi:hypothetical protein